MDFIDYIDSKDVADCIRNNKYTLSPVEKAVIVSHSSKSLDENHKAYLNIIETTQDCKIDNDMSLHETLQKIISADNKYFDLIHGNGVNFTIQNIADSKMTCFDTFRSFKSLLDAINSATPNSQDVYLPYVECHFDDKSIPSATLYFNKDNQISHIRIKKGALAKLYKAIEMNLSNDFPCPYNDGDILINYDPIYTPLCIYSSINGKKFLCAGADNLIALPCKFEDILSNVCPANEKDFELFENQEVALIKALSLLLKKELDIVQFLDVYHYYGAYNHLKSQKQNLKNRSAELRNKLKLKL